MPMPVQRVLSAGASAPLPPPSVCPPTIVSYLNLRPPDRAAPSCPELPAVPADRHLRWGTLMECEPFWWRPVSDRSGCLGQRSLELRAPRNPAASFVRLKTGGRGWRPAIVRNSSQLSAIVRNFQPFFRTCVVLVHRSCSLVPSALMENRPRPAAGSRGAGAGAGPHQTDPLNRRHGPRRSTDVAAAAPQRPQASPMGISVPDFQPPLPVHVRGLRDEHRGTAGPPRPAAPQAPPPPRPPPRPPAPQFARNFPYFSRNFP